MGKAKASRPRMSKKTGLMKKPRNLNGGIPRFRLFLPLYLLFGVSIVMSMMLGSFLETYSLMPFDEFAIGLRDNADRIAPLLDDAFNDRLQGEGLPEQHQWLEDEFHSSFKTSVREMMEERFSWYRGRHTQWLWVLALAVWMGPVYRSQRRIRRGIGSPEPDARAVRRVVNLPSFLLLLPVVGGLWKLLIEYRAINQIRDMFEHNPKGIFFASFLLVSSMAGFFNLWFTTRYVNSRMAKHVFTGRSIYELKKGRTPGLTMRIFLMIISVAAIPLILNIYLPISFNIRWFSDFLEGPDPDFLELAAAFAPLFVVVVINLSFLILQFGGITMFRKGIQRPVDGLIRSMEKVSAGDYSTRSTVLSSDEIGQLKGHFNVMVENLEEKEELRKTFGKLVSEDFVRKLIETGALVEDGAEMESTVMFTDIRNFTAFSERHSPKEVITFLNDYFREIGAPVSDFGGVVDKYIGDSIMAIFAPVYGTADHAIAALKTAMAMRTALATFNAGRSEPVAHGIGIHTGNLVLGSVGGGNYKDFSVIGDTVNVASRIESLTKVEGTDILVSQDFRNRLVLELGREGEPEAALEPAEELDLRLDILEPKCSIR